MASPLGKCWRGLLDVARDDLIADLHARGVGKHVDDLVLLADTIIGLVLTAVEGVLDGRVTNRDVALEAMLRSVYAGLEPSVQTRSSAA